MKANIKNYRDLIVWQKGMDLCEYVYRLAIKLPNEERYELSSQLRRASVSIPSNIAEGHARQSRKEYAHFLSIAQGSIAELETQLLLATRLGMLQSSDVNPVLTLSEEISRMLFVLRRKLTANP